jgi:hypothetical protein
MIQLIIIWTLLILAIALPWIIAEINFRKQVKELDKEFYREARRIDELEKRLLSKRLLAEKIILVLDDYGRSINRVEYGLPIDPDTKDFEDKRPKEMLKIVTDILNGC